ncbi:hypothetical protein Tco_0033388 [Tanacetum coccineum]
MSRCQDFMLQHMQKKYVTSRHFQDIKEKVDLVLHDIVPMISSNATNDLIDDNLPRFIANAVKKDQESAQTTDVLRAKFEKSLASVGPCGNDDFRKIDHDDHQGDNAPPEGEKRAKTQKPSKCLNLQDQVIDKDEVIPEDETPELRKEFQNVDKRVPTIFDHKRIEAALRDMMSN